MARKQNGGYNASIVQLLGEIEGFIDSVAFDHLVIGGNFNAVGFTVPSTRVSCLSDFLLDKAMRCQSHQLYTCISL